MYIIHMTISDAEGHRYRSYLITPTSDPKDANYLNYLTDVDNLDYFTNLLCPTNTILTATDSPRTVRICWEQRRELELTNEKIDFLYRSSIINNVQGSEWLIRYEGDIDNLLTKA